MGFARKLLRRAAVPATAIALALAIPMQAEAQGVIRDAEIEHILHQFGDPLFEAAGIKPSDVRIFMLNDNTLNAGVGGGNNMAINTGLIMECDDPTQLKGVMAHETGHLAAGHNVSRSQVGSAGTGVSLITMGLGVLAIAAGAPDAAMALFASAPQFSMLTVVKYVRAEESAADQYGITLMDRTHQSADGLVKFMEKFQYNELMTEMKRDPYFRTHPVSTDRLNALRVRSAEVTARAQPQSEEDIRALEMMKAKLVGYLGTPAKVLVRYPVKDQSVPAKYARAFAAYKAVDLKVAMKEIDELITIDPTYPYFYELKGQILFESGKSLESIAPHRKSVELAPTEAMLQVNLARSLIGSKVKENVEEATGVLIDTLAKEADNPFAWNQLADAYAELNQVPDADLATAEEAYYVGDMPRAMNFARRALQGLKPGTPNAIRADDIMAMADPRNIRNQRGRGH
ncbi:MAG TPA: M48 family metalloprotease [Hyphomonadaceae bacterium]|jgi:predicted Zn-dependent protease|nr:M48 family metalloprotease [Hyphomonadaceae bacterium]